jgi:hypothetical protein
VPSANTLVRRVNENAFASILQARPCPAFGRPVHLRGSPHRLQPGTSPHALRIPPRDGHPALQESQSGGFRSALVCFRLSPSCPFRPLHTFHSSRPARHYPRFWIRRSSSERRRDLNPPDQTRCSAHNTPAADFCRPVRTDHSILSPVSRTDGRSPEVSSTTFRTQPPNLQPVPLMDMGFAIICPLARHRMPQIRFLYIGSHVCSTLLSDAPSRLRPCVSLSLHLHQVVKGTCTPELSNMLGTRQKRAGQLGPAHV